MISVAALVYCLLALFPTHLGTCLPGMEVEHRISDHRSYRVQVPIGSGKATIFSWNVLHYNWRSGLYNGSRPRTRHEKMHEDTRVSKRSIHLSEIVSAFPDTVFVFQEVDSMFREGLDSLKKNGYDVLTRGTLSILWNTAFWSCKDEVLSPFLDKVVSWNPDKDTQRPSVPGSRRYLALLFEHKKTSTCLVVCNAHLQWEPANISSTMVPHQKWSIPGNGDVGEDTPWVILGDMNIDLSSQNAPDVSVVVSPSGFMASNSIVSTVDGAFSNRPICLASPASFPSDVSTRGIFFSHEATAYKPGSGYFTAFLNDRKGLGLLLDEIRSGISSAPADASHARLYFYIRNDVYKASSRSDALKKTLQDLSSSRTPVEIIRAGLLKNTGNSGHRIYVSVRVCGGSGISLGTFDIYVLYLEDHVPLDKAESIRKELERKLDLYRRFAATLPQLEQTSRPTAL